MLESGKITWFGSNDTPTNPNTSTKTKTISFLIMKLRRPTDAFRFCTIVSTVCLGRLSK
jgi:hypothetical protein